MLNQRLQQKLLQKLSPQQILLMKLLQIPSMALEQRIKQEIEENPALEETSESEEDQGEVIDGDDTGDENLEDEYDSKEDEFDLDDYMQDDEIPSYKTSTNNQSSDDERKDIPYASGLSFQEMLLSQLGLRILTNDQKVIAAAKLAAAHEMILELPNGYDTVVKGSSARLSGGQIQRIGLARALYHDPVIVVLDEPNSNLDYAGSAALNHAIRRLKSSGKSVLIMAHRPAAIQECDLLLVLDGGVQAAFGPKEEVMASMVKNAQAIWSAPVQTAGAA